MKEVNGMMRFFILLFWGLWCGKGWGMNVISGDALTEADTVEVSQVLRDSVPQSFLDKLNYYYNTWYLSKQDSVGYVDSVYIAEN